MPLHGFVNDRGTHGFVKLTHLFGGFSTDSFTCSIKDMRPSEFIEK